VVHEVPGLHPGVIAFGQRLVDAGFTVYLPSLFGRPGAPPTTGAIVRALGRVCVAREFTLLADRTSPVTHWLRALAVQAQVDCGGPGVGAVGMCLTGGFALAMAVEPAVLAPVLSQPGLPAPLTAGKRAALGLDGGRPHPGAGTDPERAVRARAAVQPGQRQPAGAVRDPAPGPG
jgi:dienelactone hydrolase